MLRHQYVVANINEKYLLQATDSIYRPGEDEFPNGSDEYHLFRDAIDYLQNTGNTKVAHKRSQWHTEHHKQT